MADVQDPTDLTKLSELMSLGTGTPSMVVGLIDGPVATDHPDLLETAFRHLDQNSSTNCKGFRSRACQHGTYVAGIMAARRGSAAPAICPGCTFLLRPIFDTGRPNATPDELAQSILDCAGAGARVLNISAAIVRSSARAERALEEALNFVATRGVMVVSAAGNQGSVGSTALTSHPWVIPVAACDQLGKPLAGSNFGSSIGCRGLSAPGQAIASLDSDGTELTATGTSAAAPFVTGTIGLLWSLFPNITASSMKRALHWQVGPRRSSIVPPLLNAWAAYRFLSG